jgi:4-amino-4-deoxy-L-arabinose transferase-like glycosyltransferase
MTSENYEVNETEPRAMSARIAVGIIALTAFLAQILTIHRYGIFRDELYYVACSKHLAWGYVDQPPFIALVTWIERMVGGDSLLALRFLPALAGAATTWLTGLLAWRLGARTYGQALASICVLVSLGYLAFFHLLTMNAFDPVLWTLAAYVVVRMIQTGNQKLWIGFGAVCGIGLENKYSMLLFGFGVVVGLLLTPERKAFKERWIWTGGALAMLIWMPNVIWNIHHHWPFLELMANVRRSGRDVALSPVAFVMQQILFMSPQTAPVWLCGIVWYFRGQKDAMRRRYTVLGWTFLVVFLVYLVLHGKAYYVWPIYPIAFAAGGTAIEQWLRAPFAWLKPLYFAVVLAIGVFLAPMTLPVLSPAQFIAYELKFHLASPQVEHQRLGPLQQQIYADMFGWDEMAHETANAYNALPADVRAKTAIAGGGYGEAAAIDFFGPQYGLPPSIAGHQSYYLWGPREYTGESILFLGEDADDLSKRCGSVQTVGHVFDPLSREDEHFDILWCRDFNIDLQKDWLRAKHYN